MSEAHRRVNSENAKKSSNLLRWKPAETEELRKLAAETKLSPRAIGARIGKSKNAVLGHAYRKGIRLPTGRAT